MASWINRTELTGSSIDQNGTTSHTCTFTAATSGNFLVAIVAGSVTSTTPSGWTLLTSAINNTGIYVFTKTASSGESSFTTTHNGSNYVIRGIVYEFPAGTSSIGSNSATGQSGTTTGPLVSSLTGTYSRFSARSWGMTSTLSTSSCVWTLPATEDYDVYTPSAGGAYDGVSLTVAYDDAQTGSSFNPSSAITNVNTAPTNGEGVAWALNVAAKATPIAAYSFDATGSAGGTIATSGTITDDSGNSNTLTVQSSAMSIVTGNTNVGVQADASTYAQVASSTAIKPTSAVTIMCWIKMLSTSWGWGQIFGRNNDESSSWGEAFSLYLDSNNNSNRGVLFHINVDSAAITSELTGATLPALNTWCHIAASWSSADGTMRFYVNGSQVVSQGQSGTSFYYGSSGNTAKYFSIFRNDQYNEIANQIQIDDVRVFDKLLSPTEINTWMNTPVTSASGSVIPLNWVAGING